MTRPLLSACIIARNEEQWLASCLDSAALLADDIIVVNNASTDRTVEIALARGARVVDDDRVGDFAALRNRSIDEARGEFLLFLDSDETVADTDVAETRRYLVRGGLPPVLLVRMRLLYPQGREMTMLAPRIIRKDSGIRYVHAVHEQLDVGECDALLSNVTLVHHGYTSPEELIRKERRNLEIAKAMGDSAHALHSRARAALSLQEWGEVLSACEKLCSAEVPPVVALEGCVLGASAGLAAGRVEAVDRFLARGKEIASYSVDILYLDFIRAGKRYLAEVAEGGSAEAGTFIRPWIFWHDPRQVELLLDIAMGRKRLAFGNPPAGGGGPGPAGTNEQQGGTGNGGNND